MSMRQDMGILSNIRPLAYADDVVIIGNTQQEVATRTNDSMKAAKPVGLEINQN